MGRLALVRFCEGWEVPVEFTKILFVSHIGVDLAIETRDTETFAVIYPGNKGNKTHKVPNDAACLIVEVALNSLRDELTFPLSAAGASRIRIFYVDRQKVWLLNQFLIDELLALSAETEGSIPLAKLRLVETLP